MAPGTRYARSGDVSIAYQVVGDGGPDLILVPGWVSNVELAWEEPSLARFLERLSSFSRLITFDKRGTGLSDRVSPHQLPSLEQRMDDVRAVMDAAKCERTGVFGVSEGGPMSAVFAATYPERTSALIMYGSYAKRIRTPDYPWAPSPQERAEFFRLVETGWGGEVDLATLAPTVAGDARFAEWWARFLRRSASPASALALAKMNTQIDIRGVLPTIGVPALILHRKGDLDVKVQESKWMAERIPGAKFVELSGDDHIPWVGDTDALLDEIEEFLTGIRRGPDPDRVLATVMFTDIVGSTERAVELGDRQWMDALAAHRTVVRWFLERYRGHEVDTAGDGFFATFDGPARGIRCALAVRAAAREHGIEIRAGLHTGEVELAGEKPGGLAVHIGARVAAEAEAGEVLVSSTVKDLVAGSGIEFGDRGAHALKGVPGLWNLWAAESP